MMATRVTDEGHKLNRDKAHSPKAPPTRTRGFGAKIIKVVVRDGREYQLHATKGWRSRRA